MKNWTEIPEIELFSDGGAQPNPGKGGFGVILSFMGKKKELFKGYKLTTNNRMELMGVIHGLEQLKTKSNVKVYTDSRYIIDSMTKGWALQWKEDNWKKKNKPVQNSDLWIKLLNLTSIHDATFIWIKGHSGHPENERCDYLANQGINLPELLDDKGFKERKNDIIEKEGDKCRKCGTILVKRKPKEKEMKTGQTYYYAYYLFCPSCKTIYLLEDGKRYIQTGSSLFE